jgi:hypothetical protein
MSSQTKPIYLRNKLEIVEYYLIKTGVLADSFRSHPRRNSTLPPRDDRIRYNHTGCRGGHRL